MNKIALPCLKKSSLLNETFEEFPQRFSMKNFMASCGDIKCKRSSLKPVCCFSDLGYCRNKAVHHGRLRGSPPSQCRYKNTILSFS